MIDGTPDATPTLLGMLAPGPLPLPVLPVLAVVLAVAYLSGATRLWRRRRRWSVWRTACFLVGCGLLAAVTGLGVEAYGYALMSVFVFQQLTLMMLIPPLLVLGSPGTLLLRATPHHGLGRGILLLAHRGLRSRGARWVLSAWCAIPLSLLAFYGLYLAKGADSILALPGGHTVLEIGFLVTGLLFTVPVLSSDPLPLRMSHAARALDVFAETALHAFFGVFLMMSGELLVTHFAGSTAALGIDPVADQQLAGGLAWSYGEAPTVLMLIYIMHRWFREDTATAAASDRYADMHGNAELDEYNAYLENLSSRDREP